MNIRQRVLALPLLAMSTAAWAGGALRAASPPTATALVAAMATSRRLKGLLPSLIQLPHLVREIQKILPS